MRGGAGNTAAVEHNWAGNVAYTAAEITRPTSVDEVRSVVAAAPRVRALGSRHSFNDVADTPGVLVSLEALPADPVLGDGRVTVSAGVRYGVLASWLAERGLALANLASLPHISVGGAVATGTHGSGDRNGCLSTAVAALEIVGADGESRRVERGEPEFAGSVVALGALGVVTRVTLDVLPAFSVAQAVYPGVPWDAVLDDLDGVFGRGYSVSLFTDWTGDALRQVWVKSLDAPPEELFGVRPAREPLHMLPGESVAAVTEQGGAPGPWLDRLPHFRLGHKPSAGAELQSEYLVPREAAVAALTRMRGLADRVAPLLQVTELRTVAADELWLSGAYGRDVLAVHFTWRLDPAGVGAVLPEIEAALLPLGARPHWGKCFATTEVAASYPRWADFMALRAHHDPTEKFSNPYLNRLT